MRRRRGDAEDAAEERARRPEEGWSRRLGRVVRSIVGAVEVGATRKTQIWEGEESLVQCRTDEFSPTNFRRL